MRSGESYEHLVEAVVSTLVASLPDAIVRRDVRLAGPNGVERQVDVLIEVPVPGLFTVRTIIECKDLNRPVSIGRVDALDSVVRDLQASNGVLVSRKGFQSGAVKKANGCGITLLRADDLKRVGELAVNVPIKVREVRPSDIEVQFTMRALISGTATLNMAETFGPAIEEMHQAVIDLGGAEAVGAGVHKWTPPPEVLARCGVRGPLGLTHEAVDMTIWHEIEESFYVGRLSDIDAALYLHNLTIEETRVLIPAKSLLFDYQTRLRKVDVSAYEGVPEPCLTIEVASNPDPGDIDWDNTRFETSIVDVSTPLAGSKPKWLGTSLK